MAVMMGNLYAALVKADTGENETQKAADEIAGYENRFAKIEADVGLQKWMVGFNIAMIAVIVAKLFLPH